MDTESTIPASVKRIGLSGKRALLIVNPISGTRSKAGIITMVKERMEKNGVELECRMTEGPGHAREMAREAVSTGTDMVLAAGGDGTINEIGNAVRDTRVILGMIPCGSGNGLGRTLGIPQEPERALDIIVSGRVLKCDYGLVNEHPFFCTCGVGFDAAVAEKFAANKRRGYITYIKSAVTEYINYSPGVYALSIEGKVVTERALLIAVCNVPQYGNNAYVAPEALITDGLLDITIVHAGSPLSDIIAGVSLFTGTIGRHRSVDVFRVPAATIVRHDAGPVQVDGEPMRMGSRLDVSCARSRLNVFAPGEPKPFKPFLTPLQSFFNDMGTNIRLNANSIRQRDKENRGK